MKDKNKTKKQLIEELVQAGEKITYGEICSSDQYDIDLGGADKKHRGTVGIISAFVGLNMSGRSKQ